MDLVAARKSFVPGDTLIAAMGDPEAWILALEQLSVPEAMPRPEEGHPITLLLEGQGMPAALRARAGRVGEHTLLVSGYGGAATAMAPGDQLTVMFQLHGRLQFWRMIVEELLPTSCYLVAASPHDRRERRSFARAQIRVWAAVWPAETDQPLMRPALLDVSAAGLSAVMADPLPLASAVMVRLADSADADPVRAGGRVVRCVRVVDGYELGIMFEELTSEAEERLHQLVAQHREQALQDRLGRRRLR